jgi:coenzyme PQQ synthesis protein D (PqqD)
MLNQNAVLFRSKDLIETDVDGETVLLSIKNGKYYGLNSTSTRIWALLESERTFQDLCQLLQEEFIVDEEQCQRELLDFLNYLLVDDLVNVANE